MPKKNVFEDEAPDNFDSLTSSLKENSETLDLVLKEIKNISDRLEDVCELTALNRVEEKMANLQNDIRNLASASRPAQQNQKIEPASQPKTHEGNLPPPPEPLRSGIILRLKNWEEFVSYASGAQMVSFTFRESDRALEVDAVKGNLVVAYVGSLPGLSTILRMWLAGVLKVSEEKVFEGTLTSR